MYILYKYLFIAITLIGILCIIKNTTQADNSNYTQTIVNENTISKDVNELTNIINLIDSNSSLNDITNAINNIELKYEKPLKDICIDFNSTNSYNKILNKLYESYNYKPVYSYKSEEETFSTDNKSIFKKDSYYISFNNDILSIKNDNTGKMRTINLANYIQGTTTAEKINILGQLQKMNGCTIEYLLDEVGAITSANNTNYGGWFMGYGISVLNDYQAFAHELGHAIDSYYKDGTNKNFSDELVSNETLHNEVLSMYKAAEQNQYYHNLIGNYEYNSVPQSEREVYAECIRCILGYSDEAHTQLYKKFLPNVLEYAATNMMEVKQKSDRERGLAHKAQEQIVPQNENIKLAKSRLGEKKDFNSLYVNRVKF